MTNFESNLTPHEFVDIVQPLQADYRPADDVIEHTHRIDLTTVTGPAGAGKDTLIKLTDIPQVISRTTRPRRSNNGILEEHGREYFFDTDLNAVYEDVAKGQYVQWAVNPYNKTFYGSRNDAYPPSGAAIIDVMMSSVTPMRALRGNFKSLESAYVTTRDFQTLAARLRGRGALAPEDITGRFNEALQSLESGLDDAQMIFIVNDDKNVAAASLKAIAERRFSRNDLDERWARACGYITLSGLREELGVARPL